MIQFPRTRDQWTVAVVSSVVGFFFGGAAIAATQRFLARYLGIR